MVELDGQTISGTIGRGTVEKLAVTRCTFDNCSLGSDTGPKLGSVAVPADRVIVRGVSLSRITQRACFVHGAAIEDVHLNELTRLGNIPLMFSACVFKHVTLSGKLSAMRINRLIHPMGFGQAAWDVANKEFYRTADWALDISKAEFQGGISLEAIPGSLVRRDEETQVLIRRNRLESADWRSLDFGRSAYKVALDCFIEGSQFDDVVLVAEKRGRSFKDNLNVLAMLRREGIAT